MKNFSKIAFLLFLSAVIVVPLVPAQTWGDATRITTSSGADERPQGCVAPSGNIQAVWHYGYNDSYTARSVDGGLTWTDHTKLNMMSGTVEPTICCTSNGTFHLVMSTLNSSSHAYLKSSNGTSWDTYFLDWGSSPNSGPATIVADSSDYLHVVWTDMQPGGAVKYVRSTSGGGSSWDSVITLGTGVANNHASMCADSNGGVHVVWVDDPNGTYEVNYLRSTDSGDTWENVVELTDPPYVTYDPKICADSNGNLHLMWLDERSGAPIEVYYRRSVDGGTTWENEVRLTNSSVHNFNANVCADTLGNVYVSWNSAADGDDEVMLISSSDSGATWGTATNLTDNAENDSMPFMFIDGAGKINMLFMSDREAGNKDVYFRLGEQSGLVDPMVDVKCNGQDSGVQVAKTENCTLTIEVFAGDYLGTRCDVFVLAQNLDSGAFYSYGYYDFPKWKAVPGNEYYTGPLNDIPLKTILDQRMPVGSYKAWLILEHRANGKLNQSAIDFYDEVDITVVP